MITGGKGGSGDFANSSMIPLVPVVPPKGGLEPEPVPAEQPPLVGRERPFAGLTLSPTGGGGVGGSEGGEISRAGTGSGTGADPGPVLRPYQLAAIAAVEAEWARGVRSTLLVLATGGGKTVVFAELARRQVRARGKRVLVLAHRGELLDQAVAKLRAIGCHAAVEQADRRAGRADVVVASVQTLRGDRLRALNPSEFGLVIVDEAHHANAASYRAILQWLDCGYVLGVTATPLRGDGAALGEVFSSVAYRYEMRDAIRDRWLAPLVARRIYVKAINLAEVRTRAGDFAADELAAALSTQEAVLGVVLPVLEHIGSRPTVVFAASVAHATAIAIAINERRPGAARVAHGELDVLSRSELLRDFRRGAFQILCNCALYTEGFDEPRVAAVVLARPTKSWALYVQMVGRGTRLLGLSLEESIANGKPNCLLLDVAGNAGRHKLIGPVDALAAGEPISDQVREECERRMSEGAEDVDALAADAARALEERATFARSSAVAQYVARDVDPFVGEEFIGEPITAAWASKPISAAQIAALVKHKIVLPAGATAGDAQRILDGIERRRKAGLSTPNQIRQLGRAGIDARQMSFARASARMEAMARAGWNPRAARPALAKIAADEALADERGRKS